MHLKNGKYTLDDAVAEAMRKNIEPSKTHLISFGNARGVRNVFERTLIAQSNRLACAENVTVEMLMAITADDINDAHSSDENLVVTLKKTGNNRQHAETDR